MGFFYFDESIHPNGKFALGAFVHAEHDLQEIVAEALRESGLIPRADEFKSGARMDRSPGLRWARENLWSIVQRHCRIGVVVAPNSPRRQLGSEALDGLKKILSTNQFESAEHQVFFDEGIFPSRGTNTREARRKALVKFALHWQTDRRETRVWPSNRRRLGGSAGGEIDGEFLFPPARRSA